MNGVGPLDHTTREIARGLADVLANALEPGAPPLAMSAAAEVARLLELRGLERVLVMAEQRTGAHRPDALTHVLERVERLLAMVRTHETVMPFVEADGELDALAATIGDQQWAPGEPAGPAVAAIALDDALPGWMLRGLPEEPVLVTAPVAAALRASLDWLGADTEQPVDVEIHDDFVALRLNVLQAEGLEGTGDVLGTVGGHLAPERAGSRRWRIVVPRLLQRQAFLLVEQGRLGLALPWHAVLKLRMLSAERAAEEAQVLPPLRWGATPAGERPAALIAHGLRRAWLFADRVVWRFAASPEEPDATPPVSGLSRAVLGEDGTLFWVADPAWLLRATPAVEPEWPIEDVAPVEEAPVETTEDAHTNGEAVVESFVDATVSGFDAPAVEMEPIVMEPLAEPALEPLPPVSEWTDDGVDDAPVEWLVTTGTERAAEQAGESRPTLSLLRPEDVEPLEASAPVADVIEAPVVESPESYVEPIAAPLAEPPHARDESSAPVAEVPSPADTASARPSRPMRALTRIAALQAAAAETPATQASAPAEPVTTPEVAEAPAAIEPVIEVPAVEAPIVAEPVVESAPVEAPVAETPALAEIEEAPPAEAPVAAVAPVEVDAPAVETPAIEPAVAVEAPASPTAVEPAAAVEPPAAVEAPAAIAAPEAHAPVEAPPAPAASAPAGPEAPTAAAAAIPSAESLEITSRLALVAEDSLVANIFLQRLLEQRGFRTVSVELGIDLARELGRGGWGLVCVDVQLPDAAGPAHLAAAVEAAAAAPTGVAVVALTRDADDEKLAREAGVVHSLRKPFEAGSVDRLFTQLGLPTRGGRK